MKECLRITVHTPLEKMKVLIPPILFILRENGQMAFHNLEDYC